MSQILPHSVIAWSNHIPAFLTVMKRHVFTFGGDACESFYVYFLSACVTRLQLKKMSVMYESAHVAITFQLLKMSSITTPNQTILNIRTRYIFFSKIFRENIGDFTDLHNEKKSGSFVKTELFWLLELVPNFVNVAALTVSKFLFYSIFSSLVCENFFSTTHE